MTNRPSDRGLSFRDGRLWLRTPWSAPAPGQILVDGEPVTGLWRRGSAGTAVCECGPWQLQVRTPASRLFTLALTNTSATAARLGAVTFARWAPEAFKPRLSTAEFREMVHGGSFRNIACGVKCVGRQVPGTEFVAHSSMVAVYQQEGGAAVLLGILPPVGEGFTDFVTVHSDPHLEGTFGCELRHVFECTVAPGQTVCTSALIGLSGAPGVDLLAAYGRLWRRRLDRPQRPPPAVGWNSWDYYSGAVTRQAMDENLAQGKRLFGDAFRVLVIDEGWEAQWGTWEANVKFPEGLADFCRHVTAQGCVPGVWTAPLLVNTYNPLFLRHPDWFAARADGQLKTDSYAYGPMAYLDPTRADVLAHLHGVFSRLRQAGFGYFKVDFSQCILGAERFADAGVGRNVLLRRAFATIRDAIGADAYLLACGAPYESVTGLVDAVRTTGDIHIYWGHVLRNAGAMAVRWWMHGNLWNCDPDFLVVRGPDTAAPPYGRRQVITPVGMDMGWVAGREFNEMEARTYALLVHLSAGDVVLGDRLLDLNATGRAMLRRVLTPRANAAVPVDLFDSDQDLPRIWISRGDADTLVGLFNWSDKPARLEFEPDRYGLKGVPADVWTGRSLRALPVRLPRRSSIALQYPN